MSASGNIVLKTTLSLNGATQFQIHSNSPSTEKTFKLK